MKWVSVSFYILFLLTVSIIKTAFSLPPRCPPSLVCPPGLVSMTLTWTLRLNRSTVSSEALKKVVKTHRCQYSYWSWQTRMMTVNILPLFVPPPHCIDVALCPSLSLNEMWWTNNCKRLEFVCWCFCCFFTRTLTSVNNWFALPRWLLMGKSRNLITDLGLSPWDRQSVIDRKGGVSYWKIFQLHCSLHVNENLLVYPQWQ